MIGLIGKKLGMGQIFAPDGTLVPVTIIQAGPCTVVQKKTNERDGYTAIQLGFGTKKLQRANKPLIGHCKKANAEPFAVLREFRTDDVDQYEVGSAVTAASLFKPGEIVDVVGWYDTNRATEAEDWVVRTMQVAGVVEKDPRPPAIGIMDEVGVPTLEAGELNGVAGLALGVGKMFQVEIAAVMFLMTGHAGELTRTHLGGVERMADAKEERLASVVRQFFLNGSEVVSGDAVRIERVVAEGVAFQAERAVRPPALLQRGEGWSSGTGEAVAVAAFRRRGGMRLGQFTRVDPVEKKVCTEQDDQRTSS
jgi:hypothetical protein